MSSNRALWQRLAKYDSIWPMVAWGDRNVRTRWYIKFEPRDWWFGVFIEGYEYEGRGPGGWKKNRWRCFVCIVPMFPIVVERRWKS